MTEGMIVFEDVTVTYADAPAPALHRVRVEIEEGALALVVGRTGSGKSTLLGLVNGHVPHFTGGLLQGRVLVAGRDTSQYPPREMCDVVGVVPQDPLSSFITDSVEEELAYTMESLGLAPDVMRRRVEETLDLLGLHELRDRPLRNLSGGQRQRVAIGAAMTSHPRVLVLDEPTSALDPGAAEDVLSALQRLVHDLGVTVLMAEHRLERVVQYADSIVTIDSGRVSQDEPARAMATAPVSPPVVDLGRTLGWSPLPLSVRDGRRAAARTRSRLSELAVERQRSGRGVDGVGGLLPKLGVAATVNGLSVEYPTSLALADVNLELHSGEVCALMGRNGSGKSTLLSTLAGSASRGTRVSGRVRLGPDVDPAHLSGRDLIRHVGLVPQEPADLLYLETVEAECAQADADAGLEPGTTWVDLARLVPGIGASTHPRDLSEGQRLALVLTLVLAAKPQVLLLDEPTRGLDYPGKRALAAALRELAANGHSVLVSTHDVEFVAASTDRVVILADGELVAEGETRDVLLSSPMFAPQVAKVMAPLPLMSVDEVRAALEGES